jgi:hypothetical protein
MATRLRALLALVCLLAAASAALHAGTGSARAAAGANAYARQIAAREAAARREAAALLALLRLPAGSMPSTAEPPGDGGYLARGVFASEAGLNAADEHAWWTFPGTPGQALAYVHEHLPAGARWWEGRYAPQAVPAREFAVLKRPDLGGVLGERVLTLRVAQLASSETALRADAEVLWLAPPFVVAHDVTLLRVTAHLVGPFHRIVRSAALRSASAIASIARLIDGGPQIRPSFLPKRCPPAFGTVLLDFHRRATMPPLAVARVTAGGCAELTLEAPGRLPVTRHTPPRLLRELEPLLGVAFP